MSKKIFLVIAMIFSFRANAGNKIKVYFNHPVDTSVSTTMNATYLNHCLPDTLIAYINRSKYTIDIAVYNYTQGLYDTIAYAVNNAYNRGVRVRWIYDGSSSNSGLNFLNHAIDTLSSPTTGSYTIMHNKFVVIDGNSTDANDPIVISGSCNWTSQQFFTDYNNTIIIQDAALAHAYTAEFNMMWGDTGLVHNWALSKFGSHKTDLGMHSFLIEGKQVELYFSPSDSTNNHIQSAIATANTDLYFGMYSFTDSIDATMIAVKHASGVYVAGIEDTSSHTYAPYSIFNVELGANFICYGGTGLYHNKYMIVDQANKCSDPLVLTGSHNWSAVANTHNDENTLIIHDDTVANMYYQSFYSNFVTNGGALTVPVGCPSLVPKIINIQQSPIIFPNPTNGDFTIGYNLADRQNVSINIYNVLGQKVTTIFDNKEHEQGNYNLDYSIKTPGIYIVQLIFGNEYFTKKILIN